MPQKKLRIAAGGSAANPPTVGHKALVHNLLVSDLFDLVIWIPSGVRPDKAGFVAPHHRVAMTHLLFPSRFFTSPDTRFQVRYDDIHGENTPTHSWIEKLRLEYPGAEIVWYTGVDSIVPQERFDGKSEIESAWYKGEELWARQSFVVIPRKGYTHPRELDLPKNFSILDIELPDTASSEIRRRIEYMEPIGDLTTPEVCAYILLNHLYRDR